MSVQIGLHTIDCIVGGIDHFGRLGVGFKGLRKIGYDRIGQMSHDDLTLMGQHLIGLQCDKAIADGMLDEVSALYIIDQYYYGAPAEHDAAKLLEAISQWLFFCEPVSEDCLHKAIRAAGAEVLMRKFGDEN